MFEYSYKFLLSEHSLPIIFVILMGISIFMYVILDGYDLGVGMLISFANNDEKDVMISSIGPFWDANETWLVLAVGILLVAFPYAQGIILTTLYIPVAIMLAGLILRGVSFDFRVKVHSKYKNLWNNLFFLGSLITSLSQGFMLGIFIEDLKYTPVSIFFGSLCAIGVAGSYCIMGSSWLILKTEGTLQKKSASWAKTSLKFTAFGIFLVSALTPFVSDRIYDKWFSFPNFIYLLPIPLSALCVILFMYKFLEDIPYENDKYSWFPLLGSTIIFLSGFIGLAYSFFPYIIPDKMTIWEAASSPESLKVILIGALIVVPTIIIYTIVVYKIFWGKARKLNY